MAYKNLTIRGKTDGFGCQLNAIYSGIAWCENVRQYRYIHTPFSSVSHGYRDCADRINSFIGIPDNRHGKKIHVKYQYMNGVFKNPAYFYNDRTLEKIRHWYWSGKESSNTDIVVHIRRGDINKYSTGKNRTRFIPNFWYNQRLPEIIKQYPEDYKITFHSEGNISDFESILDNWPNSIKDRVIWKLGLDDSHECENNMLVAFHDMCSAKVLVQSKSGLSYTAGLINNKTVYFKTGSRSTGQRLPINNWLILR